MAWLKFLACHVCGLEAACPQYLAYSSGEQVNLSMMLFLGAANSLVPNKLSISYLKLEKYMFTDVFEVVVVTVKFVVFAHLNEYMLSCCSPNSD